MISQVKGEKKKKKRPEESASVGSVSLAAFTCLFKLIPPNQALYFSKIFVNMVREKEDSGKVEWRINVGDGTSRVVNPKIKTAEKIWVWLKSLICGFILKPSGFLHKAWDIAVADPRKVIHCLKVGLALVLVSLSYYIRPLYKTVGVNAIWAVMTVAVVFEYTVG